MGVALSLPAASSKHVVEARENDAGGIMTVVGAVPRISSKKATREGRPEMAPPPPL